jgi:hypothetical protein
MTDTDDFTAKYQRHLEILSETNALNKTAVFDALLAAGIKTITVNFNGESDSGQIEEVVAYSNEGPGQIPATSIQFRFMSWGITEPTPRDLPLSEAIEDLCYDYLSQEHDGWENNDGAFGDFTFHVEDRRIELAFNARYSDFVSHGHTF